jgi:hypothetical protein
MGWSILEPRHEVLRAHNPATELRCNAEKIGEVKRIDAVAAGFLRAAQVQCVINNPATQPGIGCCLYCRQVIPFDKMHCCAVSHDGF